MSRKGVDICDGLVFNNHMSNTNTATKTPGYNCRLTIEITLDKNGNQVAHYFARGRRFRCSAKAAQLWFAQDLADRA